MRTMTCLVVLGFLSVGMASAALSDYTGGSYNWVAYNNLTATLGQALPTGVTGFTVDNDQPDDQVPSGELLNYATGAGTGVTLTVSEVDPNWDYLWVDTTPAQNAGPIFADVLGASYTGNVIAHDAGSTQLLTFSGLDPGGTYTFAGVATAPEAYHNSLSTVMIQGAEAFHNASVLTATPSFEGREYRGGPPVTMTPASGPDWMHISFVDDDLAMWTGIRPAADGSFRILVTSVLIGHREWAPGLDAIALAAEGAGAPPAPGDLDGDGDVDAVDVDLLRAAIGDPAEDLDGDGDTDGDDLVYLVEHYLQWHHSEPAGAGTVIGDITCDGDVDSMDLTAMTGGFGGVGGWASGNLNADTLVDATDLALLLANFNAHAPESVPEPATLSIIALGSLVPILSRHRRR